MTFLVRRGSIIFINVDRFFTLKDLMHTFFTSLIPSKKVSFSATATQFEPLESFAPETIETTEETSCGDHVRSLVSLDHNQSVSTVTTEGEFRHRGYSKLVESHILAGKRQLKDLRRVLVKIVEEEGSDSSLSLCELLYTNFREWDCSSLVWDMLANAYLRSGMIHDALIVLGKMTDLNFQPSISTYNNLLYSLRHTDMLWCIYHDIVSSGVPLNEYTNSILIDGLCKQLKLQDALIFFQETVRKEFKPCLVSFNALIWGFCNRGSVKVAKSLLCFMLKYGLLPDTYSYNTLIYGLCRKGSLEEALNIFEEMENHGVEPDLVTYKLLLNGVRSLGMKNGTSELIKKMMLRGLNPDIFTYTILISDHCQKGDSEGVSILREHMISQGLQLSIVSYSVLLSSLYKSGWIERDMTLISDMGAIGLDHDLIAYSILINDFCNEGDTEKTIQMYSEMLSMRVIPNSFTQAPILSVLWKKRMISEATAYFNALRKISPLVDLGLYNIMIDGCAKNGYISEAIQIYENIFIDGMTPTIVTYNSLIYAFCKGKNLDKAEMLLKTLSARGVVPTARSYTTLMDAYCEEGKIDDAFKLLREMDDKNVTPTVVTYTVLIKGLCKQQRVEESVFFFDYMYKSGLTPDQVTYNTLVQGFCEVGNFGAAFHLLKMLKRYLQPSPVTYNVLINGLCVYGKLKAADNILNECNIRLTKVAYTIIIKAHCVKGNPCRAINLFQEMIEMGFEVSIKDYSAVMNRLIKRCLMKRRVINEVKIFHSMMQHHGISPDEELLLEMIKAFSLSWDPSYILKCLSNKYEHDQKWLSF